jgi:2-amino-4-hydroxy-6-hydroxymethyldihydropteridine diphosphokinase
MTQPLWRPAYIGVGSNLDNPLEQVRRGIDSLQRVRDSSVVLQSGFYRSAPMGPQDQPDFVNAVVALMTQLAPGDLLSLTKEIERSQGRDRSAERWGPRTLDLDLLAVSAVIMSGDDLTLPHPGIAERNFVLLPWREISPHYCVPGLATVARLALALPASSAHIERMDRESTRGIRSN